MNVYIPPQFTLLQVLLVTCFMLMKSTNNNELMLTLVDIDFSCVAPPTITLSKQHLELRRTI